MTPLPTSDNRQRRRPLPALTGLRFVAAMQVVIFHLYASVASLGTAPSAAFVGKGYTGVSLFFVLSGFVLAYNYLTPDQPGVRDIRSFFRARFARVYAVHLVGVLLALPIFVRVLLRDHPLHPLGYGAEVVMLVVTLLQSWVPSAACQLNCPAWSLSVEAFFYCVFPLLGLALTRWRTSRLYIAALLCWLVSLLAASAYVMLVPDGIAVLTPAADATWINVLRFNPLVRLPEFIIGVLTGLIFLRRGAPETVRTGAGALLVAVCILAALALSQNVSYAYLHTGLYAPAFALLIYLLANGRGLLAMVLSHPVLQRLGEASFALYIVHVPFFVWFKKASSALGGDIDHSVPLALLYVLVVQLLALLIFFAVEEPARHYLRKHTDARVKAPVPESIR